MSESTMSKIIEALINPNLFGDTGEDIGYIQTLVSYVKDFHSGKMTDADEANLRLHIRWLMDTVNYNHNYGSGFDD